MSIPAPLWIVWGPVKLVLLATRPARQRREADRRDERRDEKLLAALGHGSAPAATEEAPAKPQENVIQRWAYRHRRAVGAPLAVAVGLGALRTVAALAPVGYGWAALVMTGAPPLALAAGAWWWLSQVDPKHRVGRAGAVLASVVALAWLIWPAFAAIPSPLPGSRWWILAAGTGLVAGVRELRFRTRPAPVPVVDMTPAGVWARTVGAEGPLAGTVLTKVHRVVSQDGTDVGWQADAVCTWGRHDASKVIAQRELIVSAYGRDLIDFAPERTGNALVARIMITERDPFPVDLKPKIGLRPDGMFIIGSYSDGSDAPMRLFTPGAGTHDFWFFGVKGSGKSTVVDNALGSLMSAGIVVLHLVDLKGGMSLPEWKEIAFRHGKSVADGLAMLRRLDAIGQARMAAAQELGLKVLEPSLEWPVHLGVIEEAPQLWKLKEAVEIAERIETLYRAVLISLMSISQMAELQQAWGGSNTLRTQGQAGNVGCGYVPKDQAKLGFDHFNPDMSLIKKGSYHWYVSSPVESREVLLRVAQVDSAEVAARAIPGAPNAVDLAAVKRVEDDLVAEAEKASEEAIAEEQVKTEGIGRETVARALRAASEMAGGPVRLGAVSKAFIKPDMDDLARKRIDDTVRKALGALVDSGAAHRPERGMYAVAS